MAAMDANDAVNDRYRCKNNTCQPLLDATTRRTIGQVLSIVETGALLSACPDTRIVVLHRKRLVTPNDPKLSDRGNAARHLHGGRKGGGGSRCRDARSGSLQRRLCNKSRAENSDT